MTLKGRFETGWLLAWLFLLVTLIPFRLLATFAAGQLAIRADTLLKRRLLIGVTKLDPDEIRQEGAGQLLGRVLEAELIGSMAVTGGFLGMTAVVELTLACFILAIGAGGWVHVALLIGTAVLTAWLGHRSYQHRRQWTAERLDMTNDLVERMVGHRTRLAQEPRAHWNAGEDQSLEHYFGTTRNLDRTLTVLQVLVPRGWFLVGLLGLAATFVNGNHSTTALAVAVGGIILAFRSLRNLVDGVERLMASAIAWERIKPFWQAACRYQPVGQPGFVFAGSRTTEHQAEKKPIAVSRPSFPVLPAPGGEGGNCRLPAFMERHVEIKAVPQSPPENGQPLLEVRDLIFRYRSGGEPVLRGVQLRIRPGDRLLLKGRSGGGKSTLAAVLAGCRLPSSGLLLFRGLDRVTLGADGWRGRVVLVPQFHENRILMGSFAFNLLMGRGWPPKRSDLQEAERVCRSLDLGPLLERMPAGLMQSIGETGWQLSHGEKSRLYVARALLQRPDLIILDESFAALDPETLSRTLAFILNEASTVVVIAHP
jgi:ATP-binding cassette subfamily B protein